MTNDLLVRLAQASFLIMNHDKHNVTRRAAIPLPISISLYMIFFCFVFWLWSSATCVGMDPKRFSGTVSSSTWAIHQRQRRVTLWCKRREKRSTTKECHLQTCASSTLMASALHWKAWCGSKSNCLISDAHTCSSNFRLRSFFWVSHTPMHLPRPLLPILSLRAWHNTALSPTRLSFNLLHCRCTLSRLLKCSKPMCARRQLRQHSWGPPCAALDLGCFWPPNLAQSYRFFESWFHLFGACKFRRSSAKGTCWNFVAGSTALQSNFVANATLGKHAVEPLNPSFMERPFRWTSIHF